MKRNLALVLVLVAMVTTTALAAVLSYAPYGEVSNLGGGSYKLISDVNPGHPGYGGLDFTTPTSFKFSDINVLRTTQAADPGDTCVGGSPRFQLNVDTDGNGSFDGNVFVYTQSFPDGCPADTGNLAQVGGPGEIVGTYDLTQLGGGYQGYSGSAAFFAAHPGYRIIGIQLVVDSGWSSTFADGREAITVKPTVDVTLYPPANSSACKNGGWQTLIRANGTAFKNQGDCIQYVNTGK